MKAQQKICYLAAALLARFQAFIAESFADEHRPGVLLITIDNLRPDRMSLYAYARDTTPCLQNFASESIVFDNAFSTSAWSAPGMVSIFTGYYPPGQLNG